MRKNTLITYLAVILFLLVVRPFLLAAQQQPASLSDVSINPRSGPSGTTVSISNSHPDYQYECYANGVSIGFVPNNSKLEYVAYGQPGDVISFGCLIVSETSLDPVGSFTVIGNPTAVAPPPAVDSDGDGLYDPDDACPYVFGPVNNAGCPLDSDGDGLYDSDDACPFEFGPSNNAGCPLPPDTDGDGLYDSDDACPKIFGLVDNGGCPYPTQTPQPPVEVQAQSQLLPDIEIVTAFARESGNDVIVSVNIRNNSITPAGRVDVEASTDWGSDSTTVNLGGNGNRSVNLRLSQPATSSLMTVRFPSRPTAQNRIYDIIVNIRLADGFVEANTDNNTFIINFEFQQPDPTPTPSPQPTPTPGRIPEIVNEITGNPVVLVALLCIVVIIIFAIPRVFGGGGGGGGGNPPPIPFPPQGGSPPPRTVNPTPPPGAPPLKQLQKEATRYPDLLDRCQQGRFKCRLEETSLDVAPYKITHLELVARGRESGQTTSSRQTKKLEGKVVDGLNEVVASWEEFRDELERSLRPVASNLLAELHDWLQPLLTESQIEITGHIEGSGVEANFKLYRCVGGEWREVLSWDAPVTDQREESVAEIADYRLQNPAPDVVVNALTQRLVDFILKI